MTVPRPLWFCASVIFSLAVAVMTPASMITRLLVHFAYHFLFLIFALWTLLLVREFLPDFVRRIRPHLPALVLCVALMTGIFTLSPPRMKVLPDETNLAGVSMMMHHDKTAVIPAEGFVFNGEIELIRSDLDKRPFLYPFLISIVHAVIGYDCHNGFIVNFLAGILILFSIYGLIIRFLPGEFGIVAILLTAGMPIFPIYVTTGGFEAVNILFLILTCLFFIRTLQTRSASHLGLLLLTLVLLSQCRYESIVFTLAFIALVPFIRKRMPLLAPTRILIFLPVFYLPVVWQRMLFIHAAQDSADRFGGAIAGAQAFSPDFFLENISRNLSFLLGAFPDLGISPVVSLTAALGAYLIVRQWLRNPGGIRFETRVVLAYGMLTGISLLLLLSSCRLCDYSGFSGNRFSVVFLPYLAIVSTYGIHCLAERFRWPARRVLIPLCLFHLVFFWPLGAQERLIKNHPFYYEYQKILNRIETAATGQEDILVIAQRPNLYIVNKTGAVTFHYANRNREVIADWFRQGIDRIFVIQSYDAETDRLLVPTRLDPAYRLKPLDTIKAGWGKSVVKISEVTAIDPAPNP
ncbi:MAG: glycosyltransferase family 39 protein [Thermodesulfobacteriota bacterium]